MIPNPALPPGETILEVTDLSVDFPTDDGVVHAVRKVSFSVQRGTVLGIVGESGSGKSVTCMAAMGLLPVTARITGSVKFKDEEMLGRKRSELVRFRGDAMAMIFQDPMTSLNPVYTVGWQLSEALRAHKRISKKEAKERSIELLRLVGIPQPGDRYSSYPHEFSGGMRQRAMIAMAMSNDPEVLIADEPTTALDVTVQAQILETLVEIKEETGVAIILITHDLGVVAGMADKLQVMYAGTVVESGTVDEIYYQPRMPYTAGLLGAIPSLAGDDVRLNQIQGSTPSLINLPPGCPFSPRCPLAEGVCFSMEPELAPTETATHLASCHRWEMLVGTDPRALFSTEEAPA